MKHETYAADSPDRGAMVGCTCGWRLWIDDAPVEVEDRMTWLVDQLAAHRKETAATREP